MFQRRWPDWKADHPSGSRQPLLQEQRPMTPRICFNFCRTVPDMLHFGLTNGRECYCAPYFKQVPGDGVCDAGCSGDSTVTCGSTKGMSDVYEMHACSDTIVE